MLTSPPEHFPHAAARFDAALDAWVVTRYADVLAALREPRLSASGARGGAEPDRATHARFRAEAASAAASLSGRWLAELEPLARALAGALPRDRPVDLVSELAAPWSARAAGLLARPGSDLARLIALAGDVFDSAAEPRDATLLARAEDATRELAAAFAGPLAAFHVQAFVALAHTLPCFLANAWLALLRDPESAGMLRRFPALMPEAIEELLRLAGPSRAQFRRASDEVVVGGAAVPKGGRVVLLLAAANRDPEQFPEPDRLDFRRGSPRHLAFGDGAHACIGAALVRAAAAVATAAFLERFAGARLEAPPAWRGGFAIGGPAALWVSAIR